MTTGWAITRARNELVQLSHAGLDVLAFRTEAIARLRTIVPHDTYWFPTIDPAILLVTGAVLQNIPEWAAPHFFGKRIPARRLQQVHELVSGPTPVNSLFEATRGELRRSERYRGLLNDLHLGDDLRVALMDGTRCWGYMCFHRERSSRGFTPADAAVLRPLVRHLATGLRSSLLRNAPAPGVASEQPGVIVIDDQFSIVSLNVAAEGWLDELTGPAGRPRAALPDAVCAAAARLLALERAGTPESLPPPVGRARTRGGAWVTLRATRLSTGGTPGGLAIVNRAQRSARDCTAHRAGIWTIESGESGRDAGAAWRVDASHQPASADLGQHCSRSSEGDLQ